MKGGKEDLMKERVKEWKDERRKGSLDEGKG